MVIILQGSYKDLEWSKKISKNLGNLNIKSKIYTASAHKTPEYLLTILKKYEHASPIIYVCIAGRSNALGGFVDANTVFPVINCPPPSDKFAGLDILSSLRMPSGVASLTILEPDAAALACAKILSFNQSQITKQIRNLQLKNKQDIISSKHNYD